MKGFLIAVLFFILLFLGTVGWISAAVLGIVLLFYTMTNKTTKKEYPLPAQKQVLDTEVEHQIIQVHRTERAYREAEAELKDLEDKRAYHSIDLPAYEKMVVKVSYLKSEYENAKERLNRLKRQQ